MESMDGAGFTLAHSLHQQMSPVVMVLPTPKAEDSCQRNGLCFVDLLRPFCSLGNINVPVRTASEQPFRLTEFNIRMFYASEICQPRPEVAEEFLLQVINASNDQVIAEVDGKAEEAELMNLIAEADSRGPAFKKYSREFFRTLAFSEHEAFDHPVACILVVSSSDVNPVNKFVDLYNADHLPALMNEGAIDPKILKLYVMLHDNQEGPVDRANELLLEMRSVFGVNNCRVLCINSALPDSHEAASQAAGDLWEPHLLRPMTHDAVFDTKEVEDNPKKERRGCYINTIDMEELTDFVLDLSVKHVIPSMEVKIRTLYQQVSATRKGLKNQIKNLWWRKGKDDVPDVSNGPLYTYSSPESQMRVLADYAFMLRDYELALSTYRLLSSDYKTDKAWKRYAGVQEMIGLSLFMLDQSRKESEMSMDQAINYYIKGGPSSAIYGTRSSLWFAEMHKARSQYREAAAVLSRASTEEASTRAGLLLEQAAYCYLRTAPPMLRKYGFHLVLAGNQYSNCFQRKLATQVYRSALSIFRSRDWNYIHDHVYFHLARLSTVLGNHASAVQFFKKVIACSHQSPANQAKFLSEFLFVIQSTAVQGDTLELELPTIDVKHVHVHFEDQRTYASSAAASVPEKAWSAVEDGLVPGADKIVSTWMDAKSTVAKRAADFNICVAGEEVGVDVEFSNPLQIPLDLSAVSLVCDFSTESVTEDLGLRKPKEGLEAGTVSSPSTSEGDSPPGGNMGDDVDCDDVKGDATDESQLTVSKEEFSLKPAEKFVVRLKVKPLQAGILKVTGVQWTLSGIAKGQCDFVVLGLKKRKSRKNKRDEPVPNQRLKFHVLGHMPRLDVSLHEMPGRVNTGEVRRLVLELSNPSTATVKAIKIKTSQPLFLLVGEAGDLDQEFPGCLEVQQEPPGLSGIQDAVNIEQECSTSGFIFSFPEGTALEGGSTLLWPLWLHAREAGTISLNTVVYYEPDKSITGLLYRTVRMTHTLQVLPSLKVGVHITPSPLQLQQFLLRLDIENKHSSESFWLRQVSCAGNQWSLAPLPPPVVDSREENEAAESDDVRAAFLSASVCPSQLLPASQNLSLFFKLLNVGPGKPADASDDGLTSNIKLGPPSSTEPLIDIASGPLPRFLLREKLDQPKPPLPAFLQQQVESGTGKRGARRSKTEVLPVDDGGPKGRTVDVVLISEQQDSMTTEKRDTSLQDSVRMVVHDICHCSVQSLVPLIWILEGPRFVQHDFAREPFCEVALVLTVKNCSIYDASVKMDTFDMKPLAGATGSTSVQEKRVGWFPLTGGAAGGGELSSASGDVGSGGVLAGSLEEEKLGGIVSCGPYMWCNLRSSSIPSLRAGESAEVPLHVVFFAPGIYDLSRYQISWSLLDRPVDSVKKEPVVGKQTVLGPSKQSKNTEATFAAGFAPVVDKALGVSSSTLKGSSRGTTTNGVGQGHPLLLTIMQGAL